MLLNKDTKILVTGSHGLVGSAVVRQLEEQGYKDIVGISGKKQLDLRNREIVFEKIFDTGPKVVINCAAKVGGILANKNFPADFLFDNIYSAFNLIDACAECSSVEYFIQLGSSCIYPKNILSPIRETDILTGELEETNYAYATAKLATYQYLKALYEQNGFKSLTLMPCNLYGSINENFNLEACHLVPAAIRKIVEAKKRGQTAHFWGDGLVRREFMHVDDCAKAIVFFLENNHRCQDFDIVNVGTGEDIKVKELVEKIATILNFEKENCIFEGTSVMNGVLRKVMNVSKMQSCGFFPSISLENGLELVIKDAWERFE